MVRLAYGFPCGASVPKTPRCTNSPTNAPMSATVNILLHELMDVGCLLRTTIGAILNYKRSPYVY